MQQNMMTKLMWHLFRKSFKTNLYIITDENPKDMMRRAHRTYKEILMEVDEFEKGDRFLVNILSASMLAAIYINLSVKPNLEQLTVFYREGMNNSWIIRCLANHEDHFTEAAQKKLRWQAENSQKGHNPYSWKFEYHAGKTNNEYTTVFSTCGILYLLQQLGISEITPALCAYDYAMAKLTGAEFTREYTLASGGFYCDCHYCKKAASAGKTAIAKK